MLRFTFRPKGADHPDKPRRLVLVQTRLRHQAYKAAKKYGSHMWQLSDDKGDTAGPHLATRAMLKEVRTRMAKQKHAGLRLDVIQVGGAFQHFVERCVEVSPPVKAPDVAPWLQLVYTWGFGTFKNASNLGNWLCRFIANTSDVSRHGYKDDPVWYGAAQDFGANTEQELIIIAKQFIAWATDHKHPLYQKIGTVIWTDQIWTPSEGIHHYSGIYHHHVHVDVPQGYACQP